MGQKQKTFWLKYVSIQVTYRLADGEWANIRPPKPWLLKNRAIVADFQGIVCENVISEAPKNYIAICKVWAIVLQLLL